MNNPKQNRGRHRNNARRSNPSRQNFDSNGPGVRIRGNATQVYEKYIQLARDSQGSGDRVLAETMLQHAEHYYRILNENNTGERPRQSYDDSSSDQQNSFDDTNYDDDGDDSNDADGNTGGNNNRNQNYNNNSGNNNSGNNGSGNNGSGNSANHGQGGHNQNNNNQNNNGQGNGGGRNNPRNNPGRGRGRRPQQNTAEGSEAPVEAKDSGQTPSNDVEPAPVSSGKESASTKPAAKPAERPAASAPESPVANSDDAPKAPRARTRRAPRKTASTEDNAAMEAPAQHEMKIIAD
ncbi:MAG: DUF4167 domain-containing protein [Alphaproteobacteria bacterium]|nr:DUF4167 domain-containing protein [Alphaproteobacteria bacterium]